MSGENDSIAASGIGAERLISASFSARAVRGKVWGAEPAASEFSIKSMIYNVNWWSQGGSNP